MLGPKTFLVVYLKIEPREGCGRVKGDTSNVAQEPLRPANTYVVGEDRLKPVCCTRPRVTMTMRPTMHLGRVYVRAPGSSIA